MMARPRGLLVPFRMTPFTPAPGVLRAHVAAVATCALMNEALRRAVHHSFVRLVLFLSVAPKPNPDLDGSVLRIGARLSRDRRHALRESRRRNDEAARICGNLHFSAERETKVEALQPHAGIGVVAVDAHAVGYQLAPRPQREAGADEECWYCTTGPGDRGDAQHYRQLYEAQLHRPSDLLTFTFAPRDT